MTEFEQQVRQALSESNVTGFLSVLRTAGKPESEAAVREYLDRLAARVAAAIDFIADLDEPGADPDNRQVIREQALRALRMSDETLRRGV